MLRIEDIDAARCRAEFDHGIVEDLRWLGLDWDGAIRRQSAHMADYRGVLRSLAGRGLVYRCFCTRADIAAAASAPHAGGDAPEADPYGAPLYPGTCRERHDANRVAAVGTTYALRLDMRRALAEVPPALGFFEHGVWREADPARFGDIVLARKDTPASYHLCATHDDAVQGVSLVTRGADLLAATDVHVLLQALMGWPTPQYRHHGLKAGADGDRLSKRHGSETLARLRAAGHSPRDVLAMALAD